MSLRPTLGDLVIINAVHYHEVLPCIGERLAVSSFIGQSTQALLLSSRGLEARDARVHFLARTLP
jgi:hypothetical protein